MNPTKSKYPAFFVMLLLLYSMPPLLSAQEMTKERKWELNGYVKNLQTLLFFNDAYPDLQSLQLVDTFLQDNLLHNRLNFKWYPNKHWTFYAEARNRIFFGDLVKATPDYGAQIDDANNDYFDLSAVLLDNNGWVAHSMLDRLFLEYIAGNWEVRLGRQRVNWGISNVWNPNDVFNAFSFTDFDYEERPGSDALRVKYYTGFASSLEVVVQAFDHWDEGTIAGLWRFNKWQYDFQLLGGYSEGFLTLGGGWAGNLGNAGFKGEFNYFSALEENRENAFAATIGLDYSFPNSIYTNLGVLYNSLGSSNAPIGGLFNFELSARNLYPYKWAMFAQTSYSITPLLNGGLAVIYSPVKVHPLFFNPTLTYSIKENWDLDMVGQLVFNRAEGYYTSPIQAAFLRMKFSF
jgi:hypothetical protein